VLMYDSDQIFVKSSYERLQVIWLWGLAEIYRRQSKMKAVFAFRRSIYSYRLLLLLRSTSK